MILKLILLYWTIRKVVKCVSVAQIIGITLKSDHIEWKKDKSHPSINCASDIPTNVFGVNIQKYAAISFASVSKKVGELCEDFRMTQVYELLNISSNMATTIINLQGKTDVVVYMCAKVKNGTQARWDWVYEDNIALECMDGGIPMYASVIIIIALFLMSGLFSGLNLGLMTLSPFELDILVASGTLNEVHFAKTIRPVRAHGNLLLCSLLIGNVIVNTTQAILISNLTGEGLVAVIFTSIGIVIFGEIVPQAVCSRYALAVGAYTIWITKFVLALTFVVAFPISLLLDLVLGKEGITDYSRKKVSEIIRQQGNIGTMKSDEVNIITGALKITTKTVHDIMTPLFDVYMIPYKSVLNFSTVNDIVRSGYSRIPVYLNDRKNIRALLHVKDLTFVDPDDITPLQTVIEFYNRPVHVVPDDTKLDEMLKDFSTGNSHMAFVESVPRDGSEDPMPEMIGVVTLEDVIEEIIQTQIVDETDVFTDRSMKKKRFRPAAADFSIFNDKRNVRLTPQMKVTAFRHLSSSVQTFGRKLILSSVLKLLLNSDIVVSYNQAISTTKNEQAEILYDFDKPILCCILLLEGHALVEVGSERLTFEAGPFVLFGEAILREINVKLAQEKNWKTMDTAKLVSSIKLRPDYRVTAQTDLQYLRISPDLYIKARRLSKTGGIFSKGSHVGYRPTDRKTLQSRTINSLDDVLI